MAIAQSFSFINMNSALEDLTLAKEETREGAFICPEVCCRVAGAELDGLYVHDFICCTPR